MMSNPRMPRGLRMWPAILISAVAMSFLWTLAATAQAPSPTPTPSRAAGQLADLRSELKRVAEAADKANLDLERYRRFAAWGASIGTALLVVGSFFGYQALRDAVRRGVERNLERAVSKALASSLPDILADTQQRAEDFLLRLAKLLALRSHGSYDEALLEYGWDGNVASLRQETPILRRAIIECLYSARRNRREDRDTAWEAITELTQDDTSPETNRLYLRIAFNTRRYNEGLAFIERLDEVIRADQASALRAATLLRRVGQLTRALELAELYKDDKDLGSIVTVAALLRDLGRFDHVHDLLVPAVNRLASDPASVLPDGWHRIVNTFIANSLDRGRAEDAIRSAEFVMRSSPGPVEIFTVGRLIMALPPLHPARAGLLQRFRDAIPQLMPGEATIRCRALLLQMDGAPQEALNLLNEAIRDGARPHGQGMSPDVYFQRCNVAQILIEIGRYGEAIDALMPAAGLTLGGEAKFLLAVAYASQEEGKDSVRWLTQAVHEAPKWAVHARDHDRLKNVPEVTEELARMGREDGGSAAASLGDVVH